MVCNECGRESADEFRFCPRCGKGFTAESSLPEPPNLPPEDQPKLLRGGGAVKAGTFVFGAFTVIALLAAAGRGFPPISLLEIAGWAGLAWYWQRKKSHSELAKGIVIILAVVVAAGEIAHIAIWANSKSNPVKSSKGNPFDSVFPRTETTSTPTQSVDLDAILAAAPAPTNNTGTSTCPGALPAGVKAGPLPVIESSKMVGAFGNLLSKQASWPEPDDVLLWDAHLGFGNKTDSCISMAVVELDINHRGVSSKERHTVVFQPLLGPGQAADVYVNLKIRTTDRSGDVALLGWRAISISGFKQ